MAKRVVVLAPMQPELKAVVKSFGLRPAEGDRVFTHAGSAGDWSVVTLVTGMGPALARAATRRALAAGPCAHVMVVGIAGGLDPDCRSVPSWCPAGCSSTPTVPSSNRTPSLRGVHLVAS